MGNMKPIDSALVKNETYDVLSADTMGGEYIETIGATCQNPDGYTSGSLFLGKDNDVQHLYRATAAIAFGETIMLDTNCAYTTVSGELEGKAEESEVSSLNEALTNKTDDIVDVISANGAKNLCPNTATTEVKNGLTFTINSDGTVTVTGTASATTTKNIVTNVSLPSGSYKLSGCPVGGSQSDSERYNLQMQVDSNYGHVDSGEGHAFTVNSTVNRVLINIASGMSFSTPLVFKPMFTLADQPNSDYAHYVPYAKTNRELTELTTVEHPNSGITGVDLYVFGRVVLLRLGNATVNEGEIGYLSQYKPLVDTSNEIRLKDTNNKYQIGLISIDPTHGKISVSYYVPNTTSIYGAPDGTVTGELVYMI